MRLILPSPPATIALLWWVFHLYDRQVHTRVLNFINNIVPIFVASSIDMEVGSFYERADEVVSTTGGTSDGEQNNYIPRKEKIDHSHSME